MTEMTHLKTRLVECEHPVGLKKTSVWKLPPIGFVYGRKEREDPEGVSIITRSWQVHNASKTIDPPQDFVKINRLAVKMNATSHSNHKDFRSSINIKKIVPKGTKQRRIYLPSQDFTYGRKNRTPTPVKDVINYEYARKAEDVIKMEYGAFMIEKSKVESLKPKSTKQYNLLLEKKKLSTLKDEKPIYKLNMFKDVDSKVKENLKTFKTYVEPKDNLDALIEKVEGELKTFEETNEA